MYKNYISLGNSGSTSLNNSLKSGVSTRFASLAAWQKKAFLLLFFTMFSFLGANAQIAISVTGNTNTTPALATSYTSMANALTAVNAVTAMTGPVVLTCTSGTSETAPVKGFALGSTSLDAVLSATNTITINKSGAGAVTINAGVGTSASPSATSDGMFYLSGADYVTIDGLTFTDGNTASATVAMEFGIAFFKLTAGNGCNNNTIQNCIFNMQRISNGTGTAPMLDGSWAIEVVNSTAAAATTSLTPTNGGTLSTRGSNSGNRFYSNTITGGNGGIGFGGYAASSGVGPTPTATTFLGDLGNDVGGTGASGATTGNSILNFGGGAATNPSAGIRANNQWSLNVGNNTVNNNNGSGTNHATTLRGIYLQAGTSASVTCTYNNVTIKGGATTSTITAIDNGIGGTASSNTVNINNNTIQNCAYATATSGALTLISNTASAATVNINNNILGTLTYAATSGVFTAISNSGSTGTTLNVGTNTIGSITLNSSGTHPLIVVGSPGGTANVTNNTIQTISCTATSGTLRAITATTPVGLYSVTGNTIDGLSYTAATSTGSIDGIYNNGSATLQNWNGNILRNLSTPTTGTIRGIFHNTATGTHQVKNNQVYNFSTTAGGAGGASFTGIASNYGTADVSGNLIYSLNSTGSTGGTAGTIYGLSISGTTQTVYNNAIYDLSSNSTNVTVAGINISGGTTNNVYNNLIGDLRAPFSTGNVSISGIISAGGTTNNIYHNTVNLAATTSSASTFGTSAIYFSSSTPVNNLRNNLFVNTSAAGPTGGITAAIRYTIAPTSTNFPAANNNNVYYAGTPAANKLIYTEGGAATATNGQQTIAAYKSYINTTLAVAGREGLSNSVAPTWQSTTGSNPITNFLKYSTSVATPIEQGGGTGTSITTDFTGTTLRCPNGACPGTASLPDIGAWELSGNPLPACTAPSAQPTAMVLSAATTTATVSFTAATGTPDGYLVIRTTTSTAPTNPTDGTNYSGTALGGTVASAGASVSISDTGLTASTAYWYWVYPFNSSSSCAGPVYYTGGTILSGTISTCGVAPVSSAATSIGGTGFTANWGASAGATSYILDISTSNTFATFVSGYNGTNVGNVLTLPITGLTALTTYYYRVRATNGSCTTSNSATITASTLGAIPWTEGFATTTLPNGWTNLGTIGTTTGVAGNPGNAMYKNMWSSATTGTFTMPTFAAIPANCTFSYDYKITDYGLTTATASGWGNFQLQISVNGGAFSNLGSSVTAASGVNYVTRTVDLSAYAGSNIQLKVNVTYSTGDYNLAFDNFSILAPCAAPAAPTALTQGTTGPGSITESFTPNATAPDGYMVVRYPTGSAITAPTNGTTSYATGQALGAGSISNVLSSATTTFTITGLAPTTGYDIYVYPYTISSCIGGPVFGTALSVSNHITSGCPTLSSLITVGASGADYTKLGDAILVLNGCPVSSATTVRLNTDYVPAGETFPITINTNSGASATNTITIVPQTGSSAIAWSGSSTSALLDFSGASYYTLDGRPGGSGSTNGISITNTGNGPAMRLINDAKNNTIQYTNLAAANTSNTSGVVRITTAAGSTASNGNSNNTITYCNIDGTGVSPNGIYAAGSASPADNKSNTISNNNIFNYYADPTGGSSNFGIFMAGGNGVTAAASWTISGNSFYQTATRTYANAVAANYISAIGGPFSSNGYNFTGNYIGGTAANCGGTAMTINGTGAHSFMPIQALFGGADNNTVSNNTIQNINVTTASVNNNNAGIVIAAFNAAATHAISNNTIGSTATNGSISFTGGSASTFSGIMLGSTYTGQTATAINVTGNTIASINLPSASTNNFTGILEYSNTNLALSALSSIASNTIGGTSTGVISNASLGTVVGISYAHQTGATITGNTIQNMSIANAASTAALMGINVSAGAVTSTINSNTIANLSTNSANTTATASPAIAGIQNTATIASISNNTINSLTASANAANTIHGIYNAGTVTAVNANLVYGLSSSNASATAAIMNGFYINGGTSNYNNNIVRLGTVNPTIAASIHGIFNSSGTNTNNFYFNSIYIGGSAVGTTASDTYAFRSGGAGNRTIQNNIFVNARSNGSTGGKHYAIRVAGTTVNPTGLILNNNDYLVSGTGGTFGFYNSLDVASLSAWKTAVGLDSSSFSADPYFNGATSSTPDLSINTTPASVLESQATPIAGITTDYSGATRNASTPDIGAYEFAGTSAVPTLSITSIAPSTTQCVNTARLVTVEAVAGGTTLVSGMVTLAYSINGATATVVNMNNTSGTTWTYSIPVVTPEAATITWTVNVNDGTYSITKTGASYQDNPLINYTANLAASTNALCSGSPVTLTATVTPPGTATYCTPGTVTASSYFIQNFSTTGGSTNISNLTSGLSTNNYGNYTSSMSVAQSAGNSVGFTVQANGTSTYAIRMFVDWNQNGTFEDAEIVYTSGSSYVSTPVTNSFTVPATALNGTTRMRVTLDFLNSATVNSSCSFSTSSETEDYAFVVSGATTNALLPTAYAWYDGATLLSSGSSNSYAPDTTVASTATKVYSATYTAQGCTTTIATTQSVVVTALPTAPTTTASTQCGTTVPTCAAAGGTTGQYRWYTASTGGTAIAGETASTLSTYVVSASTTLYVAINNGTCESTRTPVVVTVNTPPTLTVTANQTICNGAVGTLAVTSTLADYDTYTWSPVTNLYTNSDGTGAYVAYTTATSVYAKSTTPGSTTYTLTASMSTGTYAGCSSTATTTVVILPNPTVTTGTDTYCLTGTPSVALSTTTGYTGGSIAWAYSTNGTSYTPIGGATLATYSAPSAITTSTYYQATIKDGTGTTCTTPSTLITVNNPSVTGTTPNTRCGTGTVALAATGSAGSTLNWYAAATGGSSLGTGTSFTTPSIATTTTYYVEASAGGGGAETVGVALPNNSDGSFITTGWGVVFNATSAFTLNSVVVYPTGTGTITIQLVDSTGTEIQSTAAISLTGTGVNTSPVTLPLGFTVPIGTGYRLQVKAYTGITGLMRGSTGVSYPYTSASASVTGGYFGSVTTTNYFFYNLNLSTGCTAASRTAVTATVTTPPTLAISSPSATICAGTSTTTPVTVTSTVGDYDTYTWSPTTVTGDATGGFTFTPVAASGLTTYTLTASNASCTNTTTFGVTVNPAPSFTASASLATICNGSISTLTAVLPAAVNSYTFASTTGGTLDAMSGATTITGTGIDQTNSGVISFPSGFTFNYEGTPYTSFNLTPNGVFGLGSTLVSTTMYGSITSAAVLSPLGQDMDTGGDGGIVSLLTGTAPNRIFKVQWKVNHTWSDTNPYNNTFQLWLYEDGRIQYVYGALASTGTPSNGIGICGASTANYKSVNVTAGTVSSAAVTSNSTLPTSGTVYTFTPPVTSSVSWTPITDLYSNAAATTPYTSLANALTVYAKPTSLGLNNYVALATDLVTSCTATQTVGVTVTALPTAPVAHDAHQCGAGVPAAYVTNPNTFVSVSAPVYNVYADNNPATAASYSTTTPSALSSISASTTLYISIVSPDTGCESARTALTITVDSTPSATISYANTPFCASTSTGTAVTLTSPTGTGSATGTYSSTSGLEINTSTGAIDPTTSTAGTYTVTYTMNGGGCGTQTATTSVTVNAVPNSGFSYSASNYCTSGGTTSPTITGTAGTFTAAPSGLSINSTTGVINLAASAAGTYDITNTVVAGGCSNSVTTVTGVTITTAVNITTQPSSISKLPGQSTSFTVAATGTGTLTYQWQYSTGSGWFDLSNTGVYSTTATTTLNISDVTGLDGYQYRAMVTGTSPCAPAPSDAATLTVNTISFTLQPATQTICSDSGVSFSITTTGGTPSTYHWQYRSSAIGTFADLADSATISGANTATLTISAGFGFTSANTGNQYRCVIDQYISPINSSVATLTVNDLPAFSTTLANQTVCTSAANVTFTANATGTGLTYQWEEYTAAVPTWTAISLATASTYVINSPTTALSGNQYRVVVTGLAPAPCNTPITSAAATLTVNQAVAIGTNPTAQVLCPTTTANFSVASVTGDGLAYQWYATNGGAPIALSNGATGLGATVSGATSASLSVATPLEFNNYSFYCVVSGIAPCSVATSTSASLTLYNNAVYTVGATGADFINLTTAIAQLQTCGITQATALELIASYNGANEPAYPVVLPAISGASATNTLTIREASGVSGKVLNNASITPSAIATIDINAGTYWIIDGRVGGTGSTKDLQITNSNLSGTAIRFINDASNNTVKYVDISGVNNTITGGVVLFSTATTTGNDLNTIDNCNIRNAATTPVNGVYSEGTAAMTNDNNTLSNNNIYDYFNASLVTNGINVFSNSSAWTITGNRLYQSTNRIYTTGNTHRGINIATGEGYTVSGNVIGFANASGTGTTNMVGLTTGSFTGAFPSAYTTSGTTSNATRYIAISAAFTAAGTVSNIQNNTIAGFALYTSSGAATANGVFCGINVTAGNVNIGTTTGNTIGATSGNSSIYVASTTAGAQVVGIYTTSANAVGIQNNTFGAIDASGTSATTRAGFTGIDTAGAGTYTITNNTIGNADATNIRSGYFLSASNLTNNNGTATSTTGATAFLMGIRTTMTGNVLAVTGNTLRGWATSGTVTPVTGISTSGTLTGTTPTLDINTNNLGTSSRDFMTYSVANSGALAGITSSSVATTSNVNGNDIRGIVHSVAGSSAHTYITYTGGTAASNVSSVSNNTFTNLNVNTTGSVTFIAHSYSIAATGSISLNNNSIVTAFNKAGAGGTVTLDTTSASSPNGAIYNQTNNNFSNITVTGATGITGFTNFDGSGSSSTKTITGNTFNNWTGGTSAITAMTFGYWGGSSTSFSNNTITNITGQSSITGVSLGSSANLATLLTVSGNTITGLVSTGTGGSVTGLTCANTSTAININGNTINTLTSTSTPVTAIAVTGATATNVYSNTINTLSSSNASGVVNGITVSSGTAVNVYGNTINTLSSSGATTPGVNGVAISGGTTVKVYKNKVYDLLASGAFTTLGAVNGMLFSAGTTVSAYNNLVGDLRATAANSADAIRGISVTSTTATTSYNLYNNTVYLNASSSGAAFGTTGIYHTTNVTATTAKLDLQNNIVINTSTPGTTGVVTALRRSSATLTNFATTSNRNMYYAGTAAANRTIMTDATNFYQTYGTFFTAVGATREANSFVDTAFTAAAFFTATTGASSTYLQPNTGITTLAESGGNTQALFTDDFNGQTRPVSPGTAYDMGAWEFAGTTTAPSIVFTSVTPSTQQCTATARTIVADVTTAGGTISSVTLNYSYNGTAQTPVTMTLGSGSSYSGVIPAPTSPVNATVTWSITAVNSVPLTTIYTGTSYSDSPLTGVSAAAVATLSTVCEGSPTVLSADFSKYANTFESGISNFSLVTNTAGTGAGASLTQNATYFSQGSNSMYLTTPNTSTDVSANLNTNINLTGMTTATLTFSHIALMEFVTTSLYDFGYVEYSTNGGTSWTTFPATSYTGTASSTVFTGGNARFNSLSYTDWAAVGSGTPNNTLWKNETLAIPSAALTSSQFRIRFRYTADSSTNWNGWLIDNVKIVSSTLPITNYSWATTTAPSTEIGTGNSLSVSPTTTTSYVATLTASGCTVASNAVAITVNPTSVGGTVSSDQAICTGTAPASLTLTSNTGTVTKWQKSLTTDFASATDIAGTSTTLTGATIGSLTATTYFRAVVQSGTGIGACATANSAYATVTVNPTSVGGTVAGNQTICAASSPSTDLTLSSNTGDVVKWQKSLTTDFASATDITSTSATLTGATIGNLSATTYFRAVVQSGACAPANSTNYVTVTVNTTVAGAVSGGAATCSGSTSGLLTVADYTGSIVRWESSVSPFTTWTTIANTASTYTSGALTETTQFRAVINNSSCGEANATPTTVTIESTTWNGTGWSNGSPSSVKAAIIAGNLTTAGSGAGDITACSLTVNAGYTVVVTSGDDFNISGAVNVNATATLTFNNNANLLQGTTATTNTNSGSITSKRNATMRRLEYIYWSAPVANQNLLSFSPLTLSNRFYTFDEPTNVFVAVASPSTTVFGTSESQIAGKGFMIRAPNTFLDAPAAPQTFNGSFAGVPNNGTYTTPVSNSGTNHGYNLIGNPYPSPIDADLFLAANPGTLYFWTHAIIGSGGNNYASYTAAGATAAAANGASCNGTIQTGQGFLILTTTNGNATFTNAMRLGNNSGQFFKTASTEKHRIWLNLNSATATFNQIMVGYIEGATQGFDTSIDGSLLPYGSSALSSRIDNADYVIQGRALPFASADTVPLGFNAAAAGEFTISIDHVDGLFLGSQDIYLKDNLLGITYNIKANPYTFTSASGVFNNRFEIVYTSSPLGTHNPTFDSESVVVYKQDQVLNVNSGTTVMAKVRVFDVRGRLIFEKNNINATAVRLTDLKAEQQVLMVQITSDDNRIVTKKVVY